MRSCTHAHALAHSCTLFCLQVGNTVVASSVYYFFPTGSRHSWYDYGPSMILNVLIGDLLFIQIVLDLLQPGVLLARHVHAPAAPTQREMNELYVAPADIYVAFRLQVNAHALVLTCTHAYGPSVHSRTHAHARS